MSDAFKREIDKGTIPGVTVMVARRGQIGWFEALGRQNPAQSAPMTRDSIFRIYSMTKPIVSIGIMQLVEDGYLVLSEPLTKYIPEFSAQRSASRITASSNLCRWRGRSPSRTCCGTPPGSPTTPPATARCSGCTSNRRIRDRSISNAEHAAIVAGMPLLCQPGAEWNYSRSTDILGRIIEIVSGKSLSAYLTERILAPLQMTETAFHTARRTRTASPNHSRTTRGPMSR